MIWKKPADMHYTDLCIYVDAHIADIADENRYPEIEDRVYNYLWLVVKALAIKKCMFNDFQDYDSYSFYAANRLFFALRKNYNNQGKTIKGKLIRPIKSCLNYMKRLLYPMKIEYQRETFREVISEEFVSKKFDAYNFKEQMRASTKESLGVSRQFLDYVHSSLTNIDVLLENVLKKSPFNKNTTEYKKLKMSLMLNALYSLKTKKKLDSEITTIMLWKLPKSMSTYVRILLKEFYAEIKTEIMDCHKAADIDDATVDRILQNATEDRVQYEDEY